MQKACQRKGIVLAGGMGSRLYPSTLGISKQLLPIYDKPMIYYPLSVLMLAGIRDVLLITTPDDVACFRRLLGSGEQFGIDIQYCIQQRPAGIAQALVLADDFVAGGDLALVLGDNIFYGQGFQSTLHRANECTRGATIFAYPVRDPQRYGVISFDLDGNPCKIEEKPTYPESKYAVTGLYFYDNQAIEIAESLVPSERGELEISDLNQVYLERGLLNVERFSRGFAWLDTGTHDSMLEASSYVAAIEKRQGLKIACLEEIAFDRGFITADQLAQRADAMPNNYGKYLTELLEPVASN